MKTPLYSRIQFIIQLFTVITILYFYEFTKRLRERNCSKHCGHLCDVIVAAAKIEHGAALANARPTGEKHSRSLPAALQRHRLNSKRWQRDTSLKRTCLEDTAQNTMKPMTTNWHSVRNIYCLLRHIPTATACSVLHKHCSLFFYATRVTTSHLPV